MCYTTRMDSTTNIEETTRPEPKPAGSRENRWEIAGYGEPEDMCVSCGESPAGAGGICDACAPSEYHGYEADEDHALYWDQHAEG